MPSTIPLMQSNLSRCISTVAACLFSPFSPMCSSSKTLCTLHRRVERSRPPFGIYHPPRRLRTSRRVRPTYLFSYLSSAPYILLNGPTLSPTSPRYGTPIFFQFAPPHLPLCKTSNAPFRYLNLAGLCSCATMVDTTSPNFASKPAGYLTKTSTSAARARACIFSN